LYGLTRFLTITKEFRCTRYLIKYLINIVQQRIDRKEGGVVIDLNNDDVKRMLDSLPALIFFTDRDGRIIWANKSFKELFGDIKNPGTGDTIGALFPEDKEGLLRTIHHVNSSGEIRNRTICKIDTPRNGTKSLQFNIIPDTDNIRKNSWFIWFAWDITEQAEMERLKKDAYDQIEKNIEQFAILGDHLRNPVAAIIGFCDMLEDKTTAGKIIKQAQEIDQIITRIDQGWIESEKVRAMIKKYYDVGISGTHELIARAMHEEYISQQQKEGLTPQTNPSMRPWNDLSRHLQDANLKQADEIWKKLQLIHCAIAISIKPDETLFEFTSDETETLARQEHDRWVNEKLSRGWTYGSEIDEKQRIHNCIMPWEQLSDSQKEKDRNAVRYLPRVLAKVRLKIVRFAGS